MDMRDFPPLAHLDDGQLADLLRASEPAVFAAGEALIEQGSASGRLFLIVTGCVSVVIRRNGDTGELAKIEAPAILGEVELLTGNLPSASAMAVTQVEVRILDDEDLRRRMKAGDPATLQLVASIAAALAHRLAAMNHRIAEMLKGTTQPREADLEAFKAKVFGEWTF